MIDMSYSIEEKKDFSIPGPSTPKYPHGLRICLGKDELKKLNLEGVPQVGKKFKAEIMVEVVEVSQCDGEGDMKEHRVELQIKEMELEKEKQETDSSTVIYGE